MWTSILYFNMKVLIFLVVHRFASLVNGFNCSSKYPNTYFVTEETLEMHFSISVSSTKVTRSLIECSIDCDPNNGCAGVVFHNDVCHFLSDGTTLKADAVTPEDGIPKMIFYETSGIAEPAIVCANTRCNHYCDCSLCNTLQPAYVDCKYLKEELGYTESGIYTIDPDENGEFEAFCDMDTEGGGWTLFQRRIDASVDFYRGWADYVAGFGDLHGNVWAGLDHLHAMTPATLYDTELYIYMDTFEAETAFARFSTFHVGNAASFYQLAVSGYSGTAGDSLIPRHDGMKFSTYDADHDNAPFNCASEYKGAWWYAYCHDSNLNGQYLGGAHSTIGVGVNYHTFKTTKYSLKTTIMLVRRK